MKRLLAAALLLALPLAAQDTGAAYKLDNVAVRLDGQAGGINYGTMAAPSGCASGYVPYFNADLKLVCSPTVYAPATDTTTVGTLAAKNVTATGLATPGSITVTPTLTQVGSITTVAGSALVDGDYFTIKYDGGTVPVEFDATPGDGTTGGRVPYVFAPGDTADQIRDGLITLLNAAAPTQLTASSGGAATVALVLDTPGAVGDTNTENVADGGFAVTGFADPTAATTYTYKLVARLADGSTTEAGAASTTAAGHATLSAANYNALSAAAVSGAAGYDWYRTVGGATQGKIAATTVPTLTDTGLAGGGETAPTVNGTGVVTANKAKLGAIAGSGDDSALLLARAASNPLTSGGSHAIRDEGTYAATGDGAYSSFDAAPTMSGATAYNHLHSYQARPYFNGSGGIGAVRGHTFQLYGTGSPSAVHGFYVQDSAGSGTPGIQVGFYLEDLVKGTANYAIYSAGANTPSYHAGFFQTGAAITAAGVITGSNLKSDATVHTVRVGASAGALGYFNTYVGHLAANSANDSDQKNVCVGTRSGNAIVAGSSNVFVGYNSGYYETGSSKLMIDDRPRADEADARLKALLYGVFADDTANQVLTVNAAKVRLPYLPIYADNAAAITGGLAAGDVYRTSTGVLMVTY